ncbi:hypothetical protein B0A49_13978 [Cryomyces minteri]|uniref:Uncharacterized protein n=1 Tax=Cryomyces minteri TaxID=331657 RepID=A0A4U0XHU0_9PEZI|nr:hypothetical protein B0A49_13978 [Cryomyces minteri]
MAHVRRLHDHALLDITDAAQALRELRDDLKRKRSASTSPHQGKVASDNADKNLHACATTVEPTYTDLEEGHTVAAPGPPVSQEQNEYFCNSVSTKPVDNKQAEDERRSEGPYDNSRSPQQCESYRFTAKAQHQPRTQASAHGDGTPASLIKEASGTGRDERGSSSSEQKQPDVHDLIRKQQQPAQQRSDYAKELHDKHAAASRSKATCKKSSSSISPMATTRPVKGSKSRDTAFSPTSSLEKFSDGNTLLFTPVSPPSGGMKLYLPEPVTPKSVISSGNTPQSTLHTGQPLSKVQTAKPDEEIASVYPAPSVPSPTVKEPDVLATKGIKRRPDNPTDFERNCTRRRMS